ncbi:ap-3 complex subunit mu-1 [Moniliophthora roreri MCA 2997]|uniref:Ap-3 complex subunit mu-1 n=1 Tax=Moniliophthora roreri (strain MCA 2997) TaxID=1381753 RepID=V2WIJ8_MONRO|nr:ap-3 complex subunit mu-1 [Moniliophthora roreri MCA 2997]
MALDGLIILDGSGRPIAQSGFRDKSHLPAYPLLHIDAFNNSNTSDPVIYVPDVGGGPSACVHVASGDVRILCPVSGDVDPLLALTFIQSFNDILIDYFGSVSAEVIRENFDVVYQLFEETLDSSGHPLTTHPNALREIVIPPSLLNKLLSTVGAANAVALGTPNAGPFSSPIPWRKSNVRHTNNEIYFDMVESLSGVVNRHGTVVMSNVRGRIEANSKLSGTPDCLLTFTNPGVMQDCAFHCCVRLKRWSTNKSLSFVPPDGRFTLADYSYSPSSLASASAVTPPKTVPIPFQIKSSLDTDKTGGSFDVRLSSRLSTHTLENVRVELQLGQGASVSGVRCILSRGSGGSGFGVGGMRDSSPALEGGASWTWDSRHGMLKWEVPYVSPGSTSGWGLQGSFTSSTTSRPSRALVVRFEIQSHTFSGIKVDQLRITNTEAKVYKGVRGRSEGCVEWRW